MSDEERARRNNPTGNPLVRVCAVCGQILDTYGDDTGKVIGYLHLFNDDSHVVVPVDPGEIEANLHCDFCWAMNPEFELPARDFVMREPVPFADPDDMLRQTHMSEGHWAACSACAALIERNQWSALVRRVGESWRVRHGEPMDELAVTALRNLYRKLRKNITGSIRPIERYEPGGEG